MREVKPSVACAKLECKHVVSVERPTAYKAEQSRTAMERSAWCDRCGSFRNTVQTWIQNGLPLTVPK